MKLLDAIFVFPIQKVLLLQIESNLRLFFILSFCVVFSVVVENKFFQSENRLKLTKVVAAGGSYRYNIAQWYSIFCSIVLLRHSKFHHRPLSSIMQNDAKYKLDIL